MENQSQNQIEIKIRIAHANVRTGLSDYHDGSSLNHNLGNDDYNGSNLPDEDDDDFTYDGHEALGNELIEPEVEN